jgi:chemotaxis signal transduction protein
MTTQSTPLGTALPLAIESRKSNMVVTVDAGGHELVMETKHLAGVFQLSREQSEAASDSVVTPSGEFPVVSLVDSLQKHLGFEPKNGSLGRALIAIEHDGSVSMLKVNSVSRPIEINPANVHPIPKFANRADDVGLVSSILNLKPDSDDPNGALKLIFDPMVAIGREVNPTESYEPSRANHTSDRPAQPSEASTSKPGRGHGQLLAFVPDDISQKDAEHVFALPLAAIVEVLSTRLEVNSTLSSPFFDGYVLWRNIPVPIVSMGAVFGVASSENDQTKDSGRRLVISRASNHRLIGFYTKSQMQTMKVPVSAPIKVDAMKGRPCLGVFRTDFADMVVPDMDRILDNGF